MKHLTVCKLLGAALLAAAALWIGAAPRAVAAGPIAIGVLAPAAHPDGKAIFNAAALAADQINAAGGIAGRPVKLYTFDDAFSAGNAARAFQRAVQKDHVVAMVGVFVSEIALAMEPWAARLKTPLIVTGGSSDKIEEQVHAHYARYKYVFHGFTNSTVLGKEACAIARDLIVPRLHGAKAAIFSEDAAWTKPVDRAYKKCIPQSGMRLVDTIVFSRKTSDFTPLFNRIENSGAQVLMAALAFVGTKPVVQWHDLQVPAFMAGLNAQAGSSRFWKATNGAADSVLTLNTGANGVAVTAKTPAFYAAYANRFGPNPTHDAYSTYDAMYTLKHAIERAGSTNANKLVAAIEKTDFVGVSGRIAYYGRRNKWTHEVKYSEDPAKGMSFVGTQWQRGKQVVVWPQRLAQGPLEVPAFVRR